MNNTIKNIKNNPIEYLLYLFVFLLPWQTRWIARDFFVAGEVFEYGRISLYLFDILLGVIFLACWLGYGCREKVKNLNVFAMCLIFVAYLFVGLVWADERLISLYWAIRMMAGLGLIYVINKLNFSKVHLAITVVIAGSIQGVLGIYQFISQSVGASKWLGMSGQIAEHLGVSVVEFGLERWLRAYGSLPHPNIYGALLVVSFIALIYLLTRVNHKYYYIALLFAGSFITLGILFSYSRAAWLVFALVFIGSVVYLFKTVRDKWVRKLSRVFFVYVLLLTVVFSYATLPIVKTRLHINGPTRLEVKSNTERVSGYVQARELINDNLLVGVGMGNYSFAVKEKYSELSVWEVQSVHNVYLLVLAELGLIGFMIAGSLYFYFISWLVREKKWLMTLIFLGMSILMLFDHFWWTTAMGLYLIWLIIGLGIKEDRVVERN